MVWRLIWESYCLLPSYCARSLLVLRSFCSTLLRAHSERWTSNGRGNYERWTRDVKGKKGKVTRNWKERTKPICEQNRNRDWTKQDTSLNRTRYGFGQNRNRFRQSEARQFVCPTCNGIAFAGIWIGCNGYATALLLRCKKSYIQ